MKKVLYIIFIVAFGLVLFGCNNTKFIPKSQYGLNELAMIDDINLTLINSNLENNNLELVFQITNNTNKTITINPDTNFKLYDINKVEILNTYSNNNNIIKKGQTISYTLNYKVSNKEIYEIYFYSGIVENNIKFVVTSNDF